MEVEGSHCRGLGGAAVCCIQQCYENAGIRRERRIPVSNSTSLENANKLDVSANRKNFKLAKEKVEEGGEMVDHYCLLYQRRWVDGLQVPRCWFRQANQATLRRTLFFLP